MKDLRRKVCQRCVRCQALKAPNFSMKTKLEGTPVPTRLGGSVAVDLCQMPQVEWEKRKYNCIILAVDRLSGWTLTVPTQSKGGKISEQAVASTIFPAWAEIFGTPDSITSEKGPQFT